VRTLILFTLAWLAAACGGAKSASPPADLIGQARKLERDGQVDAAIAAYRTALVRDPNSFDAQYGIARTLDLAGSYDEARQHFAKAIDVAPDGVKEQTLRMMGIAWTFVGNIDEATRYFREVFNRRVAARNPAGAAEEANELGRVYLELGHVDQAATWYRTGHEMAGQEAGRSASQIDLADMRWAHAQARLAARRGLEKEARQQEAMVERLLDKGGNDDQRIQDAYLRGYVEFYLGHVPAAVAELEKADQQDPFILLLLAEANEKLEQPDRARDYYRKVLASTSHAVNSAFARPVARRKIDQGRSEPGR
jgi:tetratricopeptide (TPR) repeat protein